MKRETTPAPKSKKTTRAKSPSPAPTNVVPMTLATPRPVAVKPAATRAKRAPAADAIAMRAYELFEARQFEHGHDVEDWLRAEAELTTVSKPPKRTVSA